MYRTLAVLVVAMVSSGPALGQGVAVFQQGVTPLPGGGVYQGVVDTEFRASNPTEPQGDKDFVSVDQFDGGFQTQGAIRFEDLLVSDGGLIPTGLAREGIIFAELRLWKTSPSDSDANIDFNRVVGEDTTSGDFWQNDDTWASLGGDLIPDEFGLLDGDPIARDGVEAAVLPDFKDSPSRFGPTESVVLDPNEGPVLSSLVYTTDADSSDVFSAAWDGTPGDLQRAVDLSFWRFNVTDAFRDWLADTNPGLPGTQPLQANFGWSISNDTGNGWDMVSSELTESELDEFDATYFRPALTILFDDGSAGLLDIDKDGDVDVVDFNEFLDLVGGELDGPLTTGSPGDFDFDRDVDLDDFKYFKINFPGGPAGLEAALAVPEPSSCALAALAIGFVAVLRRRNGV